MHFQHLGGRGSRGGGGEGGLLSIPFFSPRDP